MKIQRNHDPSLYKSFFNSISQKTNLLGRASSQRDTVSLSLNRAIRRGGTTIGGMDSIRSLSDPSMRLTGKSIIEVKETLEKMKTLSEKAGSKSLSWEDRIGLQIEMTKLQQELYEKTYGMGMSLARPDKAGDIPSLADFNIYEQSTRTVNFLEKLLSGGSAVIKKQGNITVFANGSENVFFCTSDFELDENGCLKIGDDLFNSIPDLTKSMLGDMLTRQADSHSLLPKWMSDEDIMKNITLSLLDSEKAIESMGKIDEQMDALKEIEAEFNRLAIVDPNVNHEYKSIDSLNEKIFFTPLGVMKYHSYKDNGEPKDRLDVRLVDPKDPIGKLFAKIDKVFKDKIFSSIGFGEVYKNTEKAKGVNPEQLASIEVSKMKMAEKDAQITVQKALEDKKYEIPLLHLETMSIFLRKPQDIAG